MSFVSARRTIVAYALLYAWKKFISITHLELVFRLGLGPLRNVSRPAAVVLFFMRSDIQICDTHPEQFPYGLTPRVRAITQCLPTGCRLMRSDNLDRSAWNGTPGKSGNLDNLDRHGTARLQNPGIRIICKTTPREIRESN